MNEKEIINIINSDYNKTYNYSVGEAALSGKVLCLVDQKGKIIHKSDKGTVLLLIPYEEYLNYLSEEYRSFNLLEVDSCEFVIRWIPHLVKDKHGIMLMANSDFIIQGSELWELYDKLSEEIMDYA